MDGVGQAELKLKSVVDGNGNKAPLHFARCLLTSVQEPIIRIRNQNELVSDGKLVSFDQFWQWENSCGRWVRRDSEIQKCTSVKVADGRRSSAPPQFELLRC